MSLGFPVYWTYTIAQRLRYQSLFSIISYKESGQKLPPSKDIVAMENVIYYKIITYRMKKFISKKEEGMKVALIASFIFVFIILAIGLILTISGANSKIKITGVKKVFLICHGLIFCQSHLLL